MPHVVINVNFLGDHILTTTTIYNFSTRHFKIAAKTPQNTVILMVDSFTNPVTITVIITDHTHAITTVKITYCGTIHPKVQIQPDISAT